MSAWGGGGCWGGGGAGAPGATGPAGPAGPSGASWRVVGTIVCNGSGGAAPEAGSVNVASCSFAADDTAGHVLIVAFTTPLATATYPVLCTLYSPDSPFQVGTAWPLRANGGDGRLVGSVSLQCNNGGAVDPHDEACSVVVFIP